MQNSMNKKDKKLLISVVLLLNITFFLFGPVEYYLTNTSEIWFPLKGIIGILLLITILSSAIIFFLLYILPSNLQIIFSCLVFSLGLALYLQGNYMNPSYGLLNGQSILWSKYTIYGIINTVIWVIIFIVPLVLLKINRNKLLSKMMTYVSVFIILIQVVTMSTLLFTTDGLKEKSSSSGIGITTKDLFTFSENDNVLVYILDTFDAKYMDELVANNSDLVDAVFEDFVYYGDTLGAYPTTKGALPQILTGKWYNNETPYSQYIKEAWNNAYLYSDLIKKGYNIGIYTDHLYVPSEKKDLIVNLTEAVDSYKLEGFDNVSGVTRLFYKMVAFKYFPHYLKPYFVTYSGDLDAFKESGVYTTSNDFLFYEMLKNDGIKVQSQNVFKISHLLGAHPPYIMNADTLKVKESTAIEQCKGVLNIINTLFKELKHAGIYDKSTIIIMADHGDGSLMGQNPLFMVKDRDYKGKLKLSNLPVSYEDLPLIFSNALTNPAVNQYISSSIPMDRQRQFCYYDWFTDGSWDKDNLPPITKYVMSGGIKDFSTAKIHQKIMYDENGNPIITKYKLGSKIEFGEYSKEKNHINQYALYGFSRGEGDSSWSLGKESCLNIPLEDIPKNDLVLQINFSYILGKKQNLKIYVNDILLSDETVNTLSRSYNIPSSIIKDKNLQLKFQYPNAATPESLGMGDDSRILAYSFEDIILK